MMSAVKQTRRATTWQRIEINDGLIGIKICGQSIFLIRCCRNFVLHSL